MRGLRTPCGSIGRLTILSFAAIIAFGADAAAQARGGRGGGGRGGGGAAPAPAPSLVEQFDTNGDKWLNSAERKAARDSITSGARGRGRGGQLAPELVGKTAGKGPAIAEAGTRTYPNAPLYDEGIFRTLFFTFENSDWEKELEDFKDTDVLVPAKLVVDGKTYSDVGVRFRGNSSFFRVPSSFKRSFNVSLDMAKDEQNIDGHKTLNLLNSNEDPAMMRAVLFLHIARQFLPAPKANFTRVVINGEYWGVFQNVQQFSSEFVKENFGDKGNRWKAEGPLTYNGDNAASYRRPYEIKGKDDPAAWEALINLTRVLNQTPPAELEKALEPILNIDGALRFLALDNVLVSNDGYWLRGADYSLYRDEKGKFHVLSYDVNETFANNPSRNGQGGSPTLDPLIGINDNNRPLRSKLFAVPALREKYMGYVREIATKWLDWNTLGPMVERYRALIDADAKIDTKQLYSYDEFVAGIAGPERSLKTFAATRREFLLR
jgi:hypothetical protein